MKHGKFFAIILIALLLIVRSNAQTPSLSLDTSGLVPLPREELPEFGTYWIKRADGFTAPMPCPPRNYAPVYAVDNNTFIVDETQVLLEFEGESVLMSASLFPEDEEAPGDPLPLTIPDTRRNCEKFAAQTFALIDTNNAAINDTNLYNACLAFPDDGGTNAILQIQPFGPLGVLIKASHFDYSAEARDFALLVCDDVAKPTWKAVDFSGVSDAQDGWLVQGTVPNWKVADEMFFVVSNITCNAFFKGIPYDGPEVLLTGIALNTVVSNTITLTAEIFDLSGISNETFEVSIDGDPAQYALISNTISIDTRYNPSGVCSIYLRAFNKASVYDSTNVLADNAKLYFEGSAALPVEFQNDTYMLYSGDNSDPQIGETYALFVIDRPREIDATITDPSDGHLVAHYHSVVPYAATIQIPWDFTDADGVTPYSNDVYVVSFVAYDSAGSGGLTGILNGATAASPITPTNHIDRQGVRTAAGSIITYEEEDPSLSGGAYLNSQADEWVGALVAAYESMYASDFASWAQYEPWEIGNNRDNPTGRFPFVLTHGMEPTWANNTLLSLTNLAYSDFNYYMGHGNGTEIGGGPRGSTWINSYLDSTTAWQYSADHAAKPHWRLRKVALWGCYTDAPLETTADGRIRDWPKAFGIRPSRTQISGMLTKNVGLFFAGELPQGGYSGTTGGTSVEVACQFDYVWTTGPFPWPGACDPTYAFSWAVNVIEGMSPEMLDGKPRWIGFPYLPYSGVYDGELLTNNISNINR